MKKNTLMAIPAILALTAVVLMSGCGSSGSTETQQTESVAEVSVSEEVNNTSVVTDVVLASAESDAFTTRDLTQTADLSAAKTITVSDDETVSITEDGIYVLTGSATNACVVIEAGDEDKIQLVLDNVSIENTNQPCILVENADKVFLTSAEGSDNVLSVSGQFSGDADAVVYSKDDLVLNGLGTVAINSTGDGVCSNDDLKLTGGTWVVTVSDSAMKAHDSILACDGTFELTAANDGLHAENNDDDTTGSILIEGGNFTIQAGDDGVHATTSVTMNGGTLAINAAEGIEATQVILNDGEVSINASDDGVNAGRKSNSMNVKVEINGGALTISMGAGDTDAVDSNGDLIISGGTIDITAQSPFDYDGNCSYTGGTIIVNGTQVDSVTNQMMGGGMMGGPGGMMDGQPGDFGGNWR